MQMIKHSSVTTGENSQKSQSISTVSSFSAQAQHEAEGQLTFYQSVEVMESSLSPVPSKQPFALSSSSKKKNGRPKGSLKDPFGVMMKIMKLTKNIVAVPFVPKKGLDFSVHEENLKDLGLWGFANIEFDGSLRTDVIVKLVVSYNEQYRISYFDKCRVEVSKTSLARALKLPCKKGRPWIRAGKGGRDKRCYPSEFLVFIKEFVWNWVLLSEGVLCLPQKAFSWISMIDDGQPETVDWPGLIWCMVENELAQGVNLRECLYASHLQLLIKDQKPQLLDESWNVGGSGVKWVEVESADECSEEELIAADMIEDGNDSQASMDVLSGSGIVAEHSIQFKVGRNMAVPGANVCNAGGDQVDYACQQEAVSGGDHLNNDVDVVTVVSYEKFLEKAMLNHKACIREGDQQTENVVSAADPLEKTDAEEQKIENAQNAGDEEVGKDLGMMDFEYRKKEEQGEWLGLGKNDRGQQFLQRCSVANEKFSKDNPRAGGVGEDMETAEGEEVGHVERAESTMIFGGPFKLNHAVKGEICSKLDFSHSTLNVNRKRTRADDSRCDKPPGPEVCIDKMEKWLRLLRASQVSFTEDTSQQVHTTKQNLEQQIADRDAEIIRLKHKLGELKKQKQAEAIGLNGELHLMNNLINGYRQALKETQRKFNEYRKLLGVRDKPLYQDAGSGGVVKSIMELERERE